jgi:hypothetical protein
LTPLRALLRIESQLVVFVGHLQNCFFGPLVTYDPGYSPYFLGAVAPMLWIVQYVTHLGRHQKP